jgi:AcrR family transcriptional regulator
MSTREKIVDAAMTVVREQGVGRLTLDEAAKVANVSKGGVLYHFKTKDDLVRAMVARLIDRCEEVSQHYYNLEPDGPYRWARTVVRTCFDPNGPASDPVGGALMAAMAINPDLMVPFRTVYDRWIERLKSDSPDFERGAIIAMAMDGMCFERMLGLNLVNEEVAERVKLAALALLT